jgi:5'-nucleotidase/UDP-sugar diphosphatase
MHRSSVLLLVSLLACGKDPGETAQPIDTGDTTVDDGLLRVTILHTNDWQSHMLGWGPNAEYSPDTTGDDGTFGGLARTATLVQEIRDSSTHPVVLLDAGDFMAGALFQLLATSHAAELQVAQAMGYDAMTIGNHEYDWGPAVLAEMISTGDANGVTVPLLGANIVPSADDPSDDAMAAHIDSGRIAPNLVLSLDNGLEIGIFGLLGEEAASVAPGAAPLSFADPVETAAEMVTELETMGVDLVLGLTHAGVTDDPTSSPDEVMASEVPGIDVIVGGHSHTPLSELRLAETGTVIVQAGAYTAWLGQLDLAYDGSDWTVEGYTLHSIDDTIPGDPTVTGLVEGFLTALDEGPLADLGLAFDEPVASVPASMPLQECSETALGNFITDAFVHQMNLRNPKSPVDFAFESQGVIRDGMSQGSTGIQAFSDIFRVLPLGYGTDDVPGYGLVDFWVTADELLDTCEVTASISPSYGCSYFIEVANLRCNLDMERSQFNRARSIDRWDGDAWQPLNTDDSETLYHVAVDSYVASLMGILESLTFGAIVITPKAADGTPVTSVGDMLFDADPHQEGVQELKLWQALMGYAAGFEEIDGDGIPDIPSTYAQPAGRIVGYE